jgi:hypothetical protein
MYQFASPLMQRMLPFFQRLSQNGTRLQAPGVMSGMRTPDMLDAPLDDRWTGDAPQQTPGPWTRDRPAVPQPGPRPTDYVNGALRGAERPPEGPPLPPLNPYAGLAMELPPPPPQRGIPQGNPFPTPYGMPQGNPFPTPIGPRRHDILSNDLSLDQGRML